MAFISILIIDILAIVIFINLLFGILLGITGIILAIKNHFDKKKEKSVSKIRKIITVIFCICGAFSVIAFAVLALLYHIKIK